MKIIAPNIFMVEITPGLYCVCNCVYNFITMHRESDGEVIDREDIEQGFTLNEFAAFVERKRLSFYNSQLKKYPSRVEVELG